MGFEVLVIVQLWGQGWSQAELALPAACELLGAARW